MGSTEVKVFVIERAVHTSLGISTIWQSSFLPSGYGQRQPQPCQPDRDPGWGHEFFSLQAFGPAGTCWLPKAVASAG